MIYYQSTTDSKRSRCICPLPSPTLPQLPDFLWIEYIERARPRLEFQHLISNHVQIPPILSSRIRSSLLSLYLSMQCRAKPIISQNIPLKICCHFYVSLFDFVLYVSLS